MTRRSALLIAAVIIAALGTLLVFLYVKNVQDTTYAEQQPVTVLVAKSAVDVGTSGSKAITAGAFEEKVLPTDAVPSDALGDATGVATDVAVVPILPGQVVQQSMFGARAETGQLPVEKGKIGLSVQLGDPERVAGFVQPGSRVAVFATVTDDKGKSATRLLLPGVNVTAVGPSTAVTTTTSDAQSQEQTTEQIPKAILTLSLDQTEAEKVVFAQKDGQLYFALMTQDSRLKAGPGVDSKNLFD
jgi:pilus assembly protein CpaB